MLPFVESRDADLTIFEHSGLVFPEHLHTHVELLWIEHGVSTMRIEEKTMDVSGGNLAIVFPNVIHSYVAYREAAGLCAIFHPKLLPEAQRLLMENRPLSPLLVQEGQHEDVRYALRAMQSELKGENNALAQLAYLRLLLMRALPALELRPYAYQTEPKLIYRVIDYLSHHYMEALTLEGVAQTLHVSAHHLSHVFADKLHANFRTYINSLRIALACELLKGGASVTQACYDCGFDQHRTFDRAFRAQCGCTPRQYREGTGGGERLL
ncbi:MAG: AraC family transcriptional regulator [Clostridia bacterium]